jgi:hypothetical protein
MSRPSVRHFRRWVGRPLVTLLVLSILSVNVSAFTSESTTADVPPPQPVATPFPVTLRSITNSTPLLQPGPIERSIAAKAPRLALAGQRSGSGAKTLAPASTPPGTVHQRNWAGRHPVLLGTLIGLGIGLGDEAILCVAPKSGDNGLLPLGTRGLPCDPRVAAVVAGIGAGIGAGVGAVVAIFLR